MPDCTWSGIAALEGGRPTSCVLARPRRFPGGRSEFLLNVDIYGTCRLREASIVQRRPAGGGGRRRESSTTKCTNPTNEMGLLWFPLWRVSILECQMSGKRSRWHPFYLRLPSHVRRHAWPRAICAKRSQTWGDWGMWARAVIVCGGGSARKWNVQNEPNWPHSAFPSFRHSSRMPIMQNEPNSRGWRQCIRRDAGR